MGGLIFMLLLLAKRSSAFSSAPPLPRPLNTQWTLSRPPFIAATKYPSRDVAYPSPKRPPKQPRRRLQLKRGKARQRLASRFAKRGSVGLVLLLQRIFYGVWPVRVAADVIVSTLAASSPLVASLLIGVCVLVSSAASGEHEHWRGLCRIVIAVSVCRYFHILPAGGGVAAEIKGHLGSGRYHGLAGAGLHYTGQKTCAAGLSILARRVGLNLFEANGLFLALSYLGNTLCGSRLWMVPGLKGGDFQLRGFFCRHRGVRILSLPFDLSDTVLGSQGILSATERELLGGSAQSLAFRNWAAAPGNTLDAHSLGTLGARHLKEMGVITGCTLRLFARPAFSLGWTQGTTSICKAGDPICGCVVSKLLDPTCLMLPGGGHSYKSYLSSVAAWVVP
ncbi:unnamed protein product [Chrysoparadoxa australica]